MSHQYVLDFGARSIKLVAVSSSLRAPQVAGVFVVPHTEPQGQRTMRWRDARGLVQQQGLASDAGYIRLSEGLFTQLVEVPKGLKRTELLAAIGGELEGLLPLDLDDMTFAFDLLPAAADAPQRALAYALPRAQAEQWLADAKNVGLAPRGLLGPAAAAARLVDRLPSLAQAKLAGAVAVVDIGALHTEVYLVQQGKTIYARSFARGGEHVTQAIANAWRMPREQAEAAKQREGVVLSASFPAASASAEQIHHVVWSEVAPWLRELRQTLTVSRAAPVALLLVGGGSRLQGLTALATEQLGLPVSRLSLEDMTALGGDPDVDVAALAIGTAFDVASGRPAFDLRVGSGDSGVDFSFLRSKAVPLAAMAGSIALFAGLSTYAKLRALRVDQSVLQKRLFTDTTAHFGKPKTALEVLTTQGPSLVANPMPAMTAYDLLLELSAALPAANAATIDIMSLEIDHSRVQMRGNAKTIQEIDDIEAKLKSIKCLEEITRGETKTDSSGISRFQFTMKSRCMERT